MEASGDQYLVVDYGNQPKTRTQDSGQPLQEFATADKKLTHRVFPARHKHHVRRGPVNAFGNGVRDRVVKRKLLLQSDKTVNAVRRQILWPEVVRPVVASSVRLWKTNDRILWRSRLPPKRKKRLLTAYLLALKSNGHFRKYCSNRPEEEMAIRPWATRNEQPQGGSNVK